MDGQQAEYELDVNVTMRRKDYGGEHLSVNERLTLTSVGFLQMAGILGRFHDLSTMIKTETEGSPEPAAAEPEPCRNCGGANWNVVCSHCKETDGYEPARTAPDESGPNRTAAAAEPPDALTELDRLRVRLRVAETANEILRTELRRALQEQR